ncbi:MAG: type I glyceraldehyde-3-phosphate dehydrogenase [Syntrophales bacterium]|jgi:glyceraldehyde 3-phosphate dehydrogenase|nr:type I glyceraldehyde-3-phosphate dehydrogenase [Syntrophales bacterium]MDY0044858.1 type I glyceraldehyde-3-phosphate dehydrogenase [Syntrophales bacterium]
MSLRIAINGFGRIGRYVIRACTGREDIEVVAINTRADGQVLEHLLKYDSIHRMFNAEICAGRGALSVNGRNIKVTTIVDSLETLPWKELGIDIVMESTGKFRSREDVAKHIDAGAKKVIIAAPGKEVDATLVMGVNESSYDPKKHHIISNASCTTNCLAPIVKTVHNRFTVLKGLMTTIHSYTMDQRILDGSHKDLRRARAAALSIVPTSTGAAKAVTEVIPELAGKLDGLALRVPTPNVSLVDVALEVGSDVTVDDVNGALKEASENELQNILAYSEKELVSVDFTSSHYSSIVDAPLTQVIGNNLIKVFSWYDNESGYACRMRDLALYMASRE